MERKVKKTSISLRRTSQARLQAEVQAHGAGDGMERSFPASDTAGDARRVYTVLWSINGALHHLPVCRQPDLLLFKRVHHRLHELPDVERAYLYQD